MVHFQRFVICGHVCCHYQYEMCYQYQGTKKFRSDSPGLVNFAVGLVDFILHLPEGQVKILESHTYKNFFGLVKMIPG